MVQDGEMVSAGDVLGFDMLACRRCGPVQSCLRLPFLTFYRSGGLDIRLPIAAFVPCLCA